MPDFAVILPAAGISARFGADRNKLLEPLDGQSVIARSVHAFLQRRDVVQLIVPTREHNLLVKELPQDARIKFCEGGDCRAESVRKGLALVKPTIEWVAIHDAARPLISQLLIDRTLAAAAEHGAAVPATAVALTIKQASGPLPAKIVRTIPRHDLFAMQTPQIIRRSNLDRAFAQCSIPLNQVTDDVQLIELIGLEAWLVAGEQRNLKITNPTDIELAQMLLKSNG